MPAAPTFRDFVGNEETVMQLRIAIAAGRLPHSILLTGPRGSGKYTLAIMVAQALNCELQPRELGPLQQPLATFCGVCKNCTRIAESAELQTLIEAAVAAREDMREVDKKDTRVLIQTHPDVLVVPPDPPQLLVKLGQVRAVISSAQRAPAEAPRKLYIFSSAQFMKEAANSLLKILEEPPSFAHLILLAENSGELLPTIRSRCALFRLGQVEPARLEQVLAERKPEWKPQQRALVAHLAEGAVGRALGFDIANYQAARTDALIILRSALGTSGPQDDGHSALFKMTETYRAGADGQHKTNAMLSALASLLEDMLFLNSIAAESNAANDASANFLATRIRNVDMRPELERLAQSASFRWIENAVAGMDKVRSGMRRNLLRSLSLDAFAEELAGIRR